MRSTQPIQTATGQAYGAAKAQADAQSAAPLQNGGPTVPSQDSNVAPAPPPPVAGQRGDFLRPTESPDQHVMSGAPTGPGPGTEVAPLMASPDEVDLQALAPHMPALELMASLPNTSVTTRAFVRKLRGSIPTQGQ